MSKWNTINQEEYYRELGSLNNHPANINQDHMTCTGFFDSDEELSRHLQKLKDRAAEYDRGRI